MADCFFRKAVHHVPKLVRIQQDADLNSVHGDPRFQGSRQAHRVATRILKENGRHARALGMAVYFLFISASQFRITVMG